MKHFFLLYLILLFGCSANNNEFYFEANIDGLKENAKVQLFNYDAFQVVDSTFVRNGRIEFKGTLDYPYDAAIYIFDDKLMVKFWMEEGKITVNASKSDLSKIGMNYNPHTKGKSINPIVKRYKETMDPIYRSRDMAYREVKDSLTRKKNSMMYLDSIVSTAYRFFKNSPDNYFSLSEMINFKENYSKDQLVDYYDQLSIGLQSSPKGLVLKNYMESTGVVEGKYAPNISGIDIDDKVIELTDFTGNYVLLDFWASWCAPCIQKIENDFPIIKENYQGNLKILSYSFDADKEAWEKMSEKLSIDWDNFSNQVRMGKSPVAFKYGVQQLPTSFIIDPKGLVVKRIHYNDNLLVELEKVLSSN